MVVIFCGTDMRKLRNIAFNANGKKFEYIFVITIVITVHSNYTILTMQTSKTDVFLMLSNNQKEFFNHILFLLLAKEIYFYNERLLKYNIETQVLKKRNFLIEKIKDSKTIGIIIGTLSVKNYIQVIERMKKLIEMSSKKYYLISVGRPTVAKLANFPEVIIKLFSQNF